MTTLSVCSFRGDFVETSHDVVVAVSDHDGNLMASSGDPDLITPMRSAAKPFQALPLVEDGVVDRLEISEAELALACASHNSEKYQVAIVSDWMGRLGLAERELICGPHRALAAELGFPRQDGTCDEVDLAEPSRVASNCSGKHTGMLALAQHRGWNKNDYGLAGHPVQQRCRAAISEWCGVTESDLGVSVDGCGVISWVLPLRALAAGYARLANASGAARHIVVAMTSHPDLVAGKGRLCTALMRTYPGEIVAKVGAGGLYGVGLIGKRMGIAIKAVDGNDRAAAVGLLAVLRQLGLEPAPESALPQFSRPIILNTNGESVGHYEANGSVSFSAPNPR